MIVDAVILAGKSFIKDDDEILSDKVTYPINGIPMIDYVVGAVKDSKYINKIMISGHPGVKLSHLKNKIDYLLYSKQSFANRIKDSIIELNSQGKILFVCSDIPLINGEIIDNFIDICDKVKADVYFPIIRKEEILSKYPKTKRTFFTTSEGEFTGGNIAIVDPKVILDNLDLMTDLFEGRKKILKQVRVIGITSLIKYLFGRLSIDEIEEKASKIIKAKGKAIVYSGVEVGIDVDKKVDLVLVEDVLYRRRER